MIRMRAFVPVGSFDTGGGKTICIGIQNERE
jgi:hypothetical protein